MTAHPVPWLANPDWAILLILSGIFLIYAEFNRPGTVWLGCVGTLAVMLGIGGLEHLSVSGPGLALVVAGMALTGLGCGFPLRGALPMAGALCLGYGLARLTAPAPHWGVAGGVAAVFSGVTTWLGRVAMLARRKKRVPGPWDRRAANKVSSWSWRVPPGLKPD